MMGERRKFVLIPVLLMLLAGPVAAEDGPLKGSFWYVIDNVTEVSADAEAVVWVTLPPVWYGQKVDVGAIDPAPAGVIEDPTTGNRIIEWRLQPEPRTLEPTGSPWQYFFRYDFELTQLPVERPAGTGATSSYDKTSAEYMRYTIQEPGIQTDGRILDRAREIAGGETDPALLGRRFYDWILANLEFAPNSDTGWDALSILDDRHGSCDQFSTLFVALCRSVGIPARTVANTWIWGGRHVFAELLLPGHGWSPVDAALGQLLTSGRGGLSQEEVESTLSERNIPLGDTGWTYGNLFDNRMIISLGKNIKFHSPTLARDITLQKMVPGGSDANPAGFRLRGYNADVVHGGFYVFGDDLSEDEAHELAHQRLAKHFFKADMEDFEMDACRLHGEKTAGGLQGWINLGKAHLHKGDYYKAEAAFRRALRLDPAHYGDDNTLTVWLHNYLGNCYDLLGDREMAIEEYEKALSFHDDFRGAERYAKRYLEKPFTR